LSFDDAAWKWRRAHGTMHGGRGGLKTGAAVVLRARSLLLLMDWLLFIWSGEQVERFLLWTKMLKRTKLETEIKSVATD
jgi:hypothetical protein